MLNVEDNVENEENKLVDVGRNVAEEEKKESSSVLMVSNDRWTRPPSPTVNRKVVIQAADEQYNWSTVT